jgi:hypothetical protein
LIAEPVLIDTGLKATKMKWNHAGNVLAIAGAASPTSKDDKDTNIVQFYNPFGHVLQLFV